MADEPAPPIYAPIRRNDDTKIGAVDTMIIHTNGGSRPVLELQGSIGEDRFFAHVPLPAGWGMVKLGETDG